MKTTLDLPASLIRQIKLRALREGQKLKDAVADLLRKGLAVPAPEEPGEVVVIKKDKKTGIPVIQCKHAAAPEDELTPERVAALLLAQEVEWFNDLGRQ